MADIMLYIYTHEWRADSGLFCFSTFQRIKLVNKYYLEASYGEVDSKGLCSGNDHLQLFKSNASLGGIDRHLCGESWRLKI